MFTQIYVKQIKIRDLWLCQHIIKRCQKIERNKKDNKENPKIDKQKNKENHEISHTNIFNQESKIRKEKKKVKFKETQNVMKKELQEKLQEKS